MRRLTCPTLTADERSRLEARARRSQTARRLALRTRIALAAAGGRSNTDIADDPGIALPDVGNPFFIDKVRDVVGPHLNPSERATVLCIDEKSRGQALDRTPPPLPMSVPSISKGGAGMESF